MARRALIVLCSMTLAAALTTGALRYLGVAFVDSGPLGYLGGNQIGTVEAAGRPFSTPFFGIKNHTDQTLHVESVELVRLTDGLTVLGLGACDPTNGPCGHSLSYRTWPPRGFSLRPVEGYEIPPDGRLAVIAGWRADEPGKYRVRGIRLIYGHGLRRFATVVGPSLVVRVEGEGAGAEP